MVSPPLLPPSPAVSPDVLPPLVPDVLPPLVPDVLPLTPPPPPKLLPPGVSQRAGSSPMGSTQMSGSLMYPRVTRSPSPLVV